jgi:DNA repair protein RadC
MKTCLKPSSSIKTWALEDRPREKLALKGKSVLSDVELLAVLLRSGSRQMSAVDLARQLLSNVGNDINELAKLSVGELQKIKGIGEAKAVAIVSALELGRRRKEEELIQRKKINTSLDAFELMKPHLMDLVHEEFWVVLLNRANTVLQIRQMTSGGIAGTVVDSRQVFKLAVESLASFIILVHNHPSGNIEPSEADTKITAKMREAGKLLDIPVLDHIIFTNTAYYSFADENRII